MFFKFFNKKDRCYSGGRQHNFQPRYTEQALAPGDDMASVWQSMNTENRPKIYVYDVCVWCGTRVAPPDKAGKA